MSTAFLMGVSGGGGMKTVDIIMGEFVSLGSSIRLTINDGEYGVDTSVLDSKTLDKLICGSFELELCFADGNGTICTAICVVQGIARNIGANMYQISGVVYSISTNNNHYIGGTVHVNLQYDNTDKKLVLWLSANNVQALYYTGAPFSIKKDQIKLRSGKLIFN